MIYTSIKIEDYGVDNLLLWKVYVYRYNNSHKNENSNITYSPSCCFKLVCCYLSVDNDLNGQLLWCF